MEIIRYKKAIHIFTCFICRCNCERLFYHVDVCELKLQILLIGCYYQPSTLSTVRNIET